MAARAYLERARAAHGEVSGVLLHHALLLVRQGQRGKAIALLRRASLEDPLADKARANLSLLLMQQSRANLPEALDWARRAVKIRAQRPHNQRTLGVVALAAGRVSEAEGAFRQVLDLQPDNPDNWYHLGLACAQGGKEEEARKYLAGALKISPGLKRAKDLLAQIDRVKDK